MPQSAALSVAVVLTPLSLSSRFRGLDDLPDRAPTKATARKIAAATAAITNTDISYSFFWTANTPIQGIAGQAKRRYYTAAFNAFRASSLHRDRLCQIAWLVDIRAFGARHMISEQLHGHSINQWRDERVDAWHFDSGKAALARFGYALGI